MLGALMFFLIKLAFVCFIIYLVVEAYKKPTHSVQESSPEREPLGKQVTPIVVVKQVWKKEIGRQQGCRAMYDGGYVTCDCTRAPLVPDRLSDTMRLERFQHDKCPGCNCDLYTVAME